MYIYKFISHKSVNTKPFRTKDQLCNVVLENWAEIETGDVNKMKILLVKESGRRCILHTLSDACYRVFLILNSSRCLYAYISILPGKLFLQI
jgi:hypothetical protein